VEPGAVGHVDARADARIRAEHHAAIVHARHDSGARLGRLIVLHAVHLGAALQWLPLEECRVGAGALHFFGVRRRTELLEGWAIFFFKNCSDFHPNFSPPYWSRRGLRWKAHG
jgi:hypothetical protein